MFKKKTWLVLILALSLILNFNILFCESSVSLFSENIIINEVMYNPKENDNYNEWIELFNPTNHSINLSDWSITDNSATDTLEKNIDYGNGTTILPSKGYAIITDKGTKLYDNTQIPDNTIKIYVDDKSIGNGLSNSKDKIILKDPKDNVISSIEWGFNYSDIPGLPLDLVDEGHSLSRYPNCNTNNSYYDFYDGLQCTPGRKNIITQLTIDKYPKYLPKTTKENDYSLPFSIHIKASGLIINESYQLKTYVTGNLNQIYPATQTWNTNKWKYSNYYTHNITTDTNGNWSNWIHLRFNKEYNEYKNNIKNNSNAYIKIKIKKENLTKETYQQIQLLDLDNSTTNGTLGGYLIGQIKDNLTFLQNTTIIIENKTTNITGIFKTENNNIDDTLISAPGYYKIASPVGSNYTIKFYDKNNTIIKTKSEVTIKPGKYDINLFSSKRNYQVKKNESLNITITAKNIGNFPDNTTILMQDVTKHCITSLKPCRISLNPKEMRDLIVSITPRLNDNCRELQLNITATSESDIGENERVTVNIEILAPDLITTNLTCIDLNQEDTIGEGEIVTLKARVKNQGNMNASDVDVTFYYDNIDEEHIIGIKHYDTITKYQRYPSVNWDTKNIPIGKHTIFVVVDAKKQILEHDETNNEDSFIVKVIDTKPINISKKIVISELYYHTHSNVKNEYTTIFNPTISEVDISGWYITNKPWKNKEDQTKIIFPENTKIPSKSSLYVTQNASAYLWETGKHPDFEYAVDAMDTVRQMISAKSFTLSNNGGMVALKDGFNHTIDCIRYGKSENNLEGWEKDAVLDCGVGVVLKRRFDSNNQPIDSNTSNDWRHPRRFGIGQSSFPFKKISFKGTVKTFISPDNSYKAIIDELRNATKSIYFNIYEFTNPFLCEELVNALKRNVSVCVFLEGSPIGGIDDREKYIVNKLFRYGGKIRFIVNDKENDVYARYTFDHGKYLIIDNQTVIVESCNWVKTGIPIDPTFGNREWGIIVRSVDVAEYFLDVFLDDWNHNRCDSYCLSEMDFSIPLDFYMDETKISGRYNPYFEAHSFNGNFSAIPVFSPDTSYNAILNMIDSANESIYVEQLYIYTNWSDGNSPFVESLIEKSNEGVDVKVIMNYNPCYKPTNEKVNVTKKYFEEHNISVKFVFTNWSYFANVHNKGMIVDNKSVLVSSINWNENSVTRNREAGIIIENDDVALYYADVFLFDWNLKAPEKNGEKKEVSLVEYKNQFLIALVYGATFVLIAVDWRKREWQ